MAPRCLHDDVRPGAPCRDHYSPLGLRRIGLGFASAAAALIALSACGSRSKDVEDPASPEPRACTEIGCIDGLHIELEPNASWAPGRYRFVLEAGGAEQVCEATIPLPPCEAPPVTCSGASFAQIGASGCAMPPAQHGFATIHFPDAHEQVRVLVERDGEPLLDQALQPTYRTLQPNGPGCGPTCRSANARLSVPQGPPASADSAPATP